MKSAYQSQAYFDLYNFNSDCHLMFEKSKFKILKVFIPTSEYNRINVKVLAENTQNSEKLIQIADIGIDKGKSLLQLMGWEKGKDWQIMQIDKKVLQTLTQGKKIGKSKSWKKIASKNIKNIKLSDIEKPAKGMYQKLYIKRYKSNN